MCRTETNRAEGFRIYINLYIVCRNSSDNKLSWWVDKKKQLIFTGFSMKDSTCSIKLMKPENYIVSEACD